MKESGKFRFRRIARTVIRDINFAKDCARYFKGQPGSSSNLSTQFNIKEFQTHGCGSSEVPNRAKVILRKPADRRTRAELRELLFLVRRLKSFEKYEDIDQMGLARILHYNCFSARKIMLKEGHPGKAFYFIVAGRISVRVRDASNVEGYQIINEMGPGDSFGELALLDPNNIRTATVVCTTPVEVLRVDKHEFDVILRRSHEEDVQFKYATLRKHEWLCTYSNASLKELVNHCHRKHFRPQGIVFHGHKPGEMNYVLVLASGAARLLRSIDVFLCRHTGLVQTEVGRSCSCRACKHAMFVKRSEAKVTTQKKLVGTDAQKQSLHPRAATTAGGGKKKTRTRASMSPSSGSKKCSTDFHGAPQHSSQSAKPPVVTCNVIVDDVDDPAARGSGHGQVIKATQTAPRDGVQPRQSRHAGKRGRGPGHTHHCVAKKVWISSRLLPIGSVVTDWQDNTALLSEGSEWLFIPRSRFLKHDHGRTLTRLYRATPMLSMTDQEVFHAFDLNQQWEFYRHEVYAQTLLNQQTTS